MLTSSLTIQRSGVTVGRFVLGFVTARCFPTEKHAVAFYLTISVVLQLLFWLIPSFAVSAVMVSLLGFVSEMQYFINGFLTDTVPCTFVSSRYCCNDQVIAKEIARRSCRICSGCGRFWCNSKFIHRFSFV